LTSLSWCGESGRDDELIMEKKIEASLGEARWFFSLFPNLLRAKRSIQVLFAYSSTLFSSQRVPRDQ